MSLRIRENALYLAAGLSAVFMAFASYVAGVPLKFAVFVAFLFAVVYYGEKFKKQFGVPLIFKREGQMNKWGARFGGLTGGIGGYYGARFGSEVAGSNISGLADFAVNLGLGLTVFMLASILYMATILQDIQDGHIQL